MERGTDLRMWVYSEIHTYGHMSSQSVVYLVVDFGGFEIVRTFFANYSDSGYGPDI